MSEPVLQYEDLLLQNAMLRRKLGEALDEAASIAASVSDSDVDSFYDDGMHAAALIRQLKVKYGVAE
jgi:uncharacterized protein with HEPN domain